MDVKILGIGRCAIGLMRKNLVGEIDLISNKPRSVLSFDHHYILNPLTPTQTGIHKLPWNEFSACEAKPTLADQLLCTAHAEDYNICIIEIFPPAPLYFNSRLNVFACFESFTKDLRTSGFIPCSEKDQSCESPAGPELYVKNLSRLINVLQNKNEALRIILLNPELLFDQNLSPVNTPLLHEIMAGVKQNILKRYPSVVLLDINQVLGELSKQGIAFYDTEFPLSYIRHTPDLEPIGVARDCKHASPFLRKYFALEVYEILSKWGCSPIERPAIPEAPIEFMPADYAERAAQFLKINSQKKPQEILCEDSRFFSRYVEYTLFTKDTTGQDHLNRSLTGFNRILNGDGRCLVDYLYHMRSMCVYLYATSPCLLKEVTDIGTSVLNLARETSDFYMTYVLLWIKNLFFACRQIMRHHPKISTSGFESFISELKKREDLKRHETIMNIIAWKENQ